jgi:molecular chaperone DnaK
MVQEAKQHESEDTRRKQLVEARNTGDTMAYQTEKLMNELGERVPQGMREDLHNKVGELRQAIQGDDTGRIRRAIDDLQNAANALQAQAQATTAQGQGQTQQGGPTGDNPQGGTGEGGDVVEGEFHEA